MADYGASDTSTTSLGANQFPISEVYVPNVGLTALEGGAQSTDGTGKKSSPANMSIKDGSDLSGGATTDVAVTGDVAGSRSAKLRGLNKILADIWDSVNHFFRVADIEQASYIAATSPPTATNVGTDTTYTFSAQVNRIIIQNNTSANVSFAFDVAASAGSLLVVPGALLVYPKKCTVLHLFTAAAQNLNGTSGNNIVVLGAL